MYDILCIISTLIWRTICFRYPVNAKTVLACYVTMWRQRVSKGNPFTVYKIESK